MKYHVFGIGNALVDKEFEVSDEFLNKHKIEKSFMTLIDEDQKALLEKELMQSADLVKQAGGGSAANSIVAISQFGGNSYYACRTANDSNGHFYQKNLHEAGVETALHTKNYEGITGTCLVMVTNDAERTMNTFLGITSDLDENDINFEALKLSEYLYIEGYLVTSDISRQAALQAKQIAHQHQVKTAFTFSDPSMVTYFKSGIDEILAGGIDILFSNEEEALTYTDTASVDEAAQALLAHANKLVITRGSQGACIYTRQSAIDIPAVKADPVDTNGAGDMFAGAFMYGITHGLDDLQAGTLASASAAKLIETFGARLDKDQHHALREQYISGLNFGK